MDEREAAALKKEYILLYRGKNIDSLSIEELRRALKQAYGELEQLRKCKAEMRALVGEDG